VVAKACQNVVLIDNTSGRTKAFVAMIVTSIALSSTGLIIRNIEVATPWQINIYRNLAFFCAVSFIFLLRHRSQSLSQISQVTYPVIWAGCALAVTGIAVIQSFTHTLVANTVFIMSTVPLMTMALAYIILKETVSKVVLITMLISSMGVILMIGGGIETGSTYGNLMALVAACGFSCFALIARANHHLEMLPALMIASILIVAISIIFSFDSLSVTFDDLLLCVLWGAGISGIAHWVFILSARFMAAAELTLFGLFESSLAPIWVWFYISETPAVWTVIGGLAIIISVGFVSIFEMKKA